MCGRWLKNTTWRANPTVTESRIRKWGATGGRIRLTESAGISASKQGSLTSTGGEVEGDLARADLPLPLGGDQCGGGGDQIRSEGDEESGESEAMSLARARVVSVRCARRQEQPAGEVPEAAGTGAGGAGGGSVASGVRASGRQGVPRA
jgi:hypothetical protein